MQRHSKRATRIIHHYFFRPLRLPSCHECFVGSPVLVCTAGTTGPLYLQGGQHVSQPTFFPPKTGLDVAAGVCLQIIL